EEWLARRDRVRDGAEHLRDAGRAALARPVGGEDAALGPEGDRPHRDAGVQPREAEVGGEGDAGSRRDEVLHGGVVVELEADAGLEPGGPAGPRGELVARGA